MFAHTHTVNGSSFNCTAAAAKDTGVADVVLGVGFFVGMLASFIPQLVKVAGRRSSVGISPVWAFCSANMATANVIGALLLQHGLFSCCHSALPGQCVELLLPLLTLFLQICMCCSVFSLCAWHSAWVTQADPKFHLVDVKRWRQLFVAWAAFFVGAWSLTAGLLASAHSEPRTSTTALINVAGNAFGISATVLTCVQYIPQLWTTCQLRDAGSFSLVTLAIQAPGSLGWAIYLAATGSALSTWTPPAVTGSMQSALFIMCVVFQRAKKKMGYSGGVDEDDMERDADSLRAHLDEYGAVGSRVGRSGGGGGSGGSGGGGLTRPLLESS